jgi:hypothetical protein
MSAGARHSTKRLEDKSSRFLGVSRKRDGGRGAWGAQITIDRTRHALGFWATEREAAEAYDRAALHFLGPKATRNFPRRSLSAADAETLKVEARRRFKQQTASGYRGIFPLRQRWQARFNHGRKHESLGGWLTQHKAAEAYDRAARFFLGDQAQLNFPARRLQPMSPSELRRMSTVERKAQTTTSKYVGVHFRGGIRPWLAELAPPGKKHRGLGSWRSELDAARAYDRAAHFYFGGDAELNLPDENLEPADAPTLAAEARREFKASCTSEYVGVAWDRRQQLWRALSRRGTTTFYLGGYQRELDAALAYDAKSVDFGDRFARVNFHPETGERTWGKRIVDLLSDQLGAARLGRPAIIRPLRLTGERKAPSR